ncbi:hypothetical protein [Deinococcus sp.]|uniref:hypothetical protein n=1 Tax=Deinococcus sp. TaxID=47478 RepID=UPI0025D517FA|nr:hypothetical protein [Deinococcus sp.]
MLPTLLLGLALAAPASPYSLRLGLSDSEWNGIVSNTGGKVEQGYTVTQILKMPGGDTLVRWSSTPGLDPKGPHSLGVQLYGPGNVFRRWLPDTARIDRDFLLCDRLVIGGGNTLRAWDSSRDYALAKLPQAPILPDSTRLSCQGGLVVAEMPNGPKRWKRVLTWRLR